MKSWKARLLAVATAMFFAASLVSVIGGPWNTYGHHTAFTGLAETAFCGAFLVGELRRGSKE